MASGYTPSPSDQHELLKQILSAVQSIQEDCQNLSAAVESIQAQVDTLSEGKKVHDTAGRNHPSQEGIAPAPPSAMGDQRVASDTEPGSNAHASSLEFGSAGPSEAYGDGDYLHGRKSSTTATSRIILTTYPNQSGIDPLIMNWGHIDPLERGPVVVSRSQSSVRRRNGKRG